MFPVLGALVGVFARVLVVVFAAVPAALVLSLPVF